ncbi:MauE/DoxX family redox-associated membrane protein [Algoriphagus formosus]|uniref:DoxX family membrane protein n=1 Tax=Algoriphagus formosus TaxID=2007308 RepID=A0A4R5UST1_9BACT|nr:MauE/DoxX family redox-associated membrane protein [Algoriphagus aquimaris]TDK42055.1 DoxX family membrane protein [Algoriphagus aquimaris]
MELVVRVVLILLWTYTGLEKLIGFESSRKAFLNQPMPNELEEILAVAVPSLELLLAFLLLLKITRWWGYLGSIILLTVFVTYVGLIWVGAFPRVPCSCAGLIDSMGWTAHMILNLNLLILAIVGLLIESKKEAGYNLTSLGVKQPRPKPFYH